MTLTRQRPGVAAPVENPDKPVPPNAVTRTTQTSPEPPPPTPVITPGTSPFAGFHERRDTLRAFVESELISGTDYGPGFETSQGRKGKPILLKPGAEKFALWLGWRAVFKMDAATWSMTGGQAGTFCYICRLIGPTGVAGEGRGAASIAEKKGWSANNAIKIACKRAQVDAVLRAVGLSEYFTQDLDDESQAAALHAAARPQPGRPPTTDARASEPAGLLTAPEDPPPNPKRAAYIREVRAWYGVIDQHSEGYARATAWMKGHVTEWNEAHPGAPIDWAALLSDVVNARFEQFPAGHLHG